jgi:dolichol kinase
MGDSLSIRTEIKRKSIHLFTTVIPFLYFFFLNKEQILLICIILSTGFLTFDLLRIYNRTAKRIFMQIFAGLLRDNEKSGKLTGATLLFLGMTLSVCLFPEQIAVTAMVFLTLADPVAAIAGKRWGSVAIFNKTMQGSMGFFLTAVLLTMLVWGFSWQGIVVAGTAAVIELLPLQVNDNITIPVVSGILMSYLY